MLGIERGHATKVLSRLAETEHVVRLMRGRRGVCEPRWGTPDSKLSYVRGALSEPGVRWLPTGIRKEYSRAMASNREPSDRELDDIAQELIDIDDRVDLEQVVGVGQLLLDRVFRGNPENFDLSLLPRHQLEYLAQAAELTAEEFTHRMDIFVLSNRLGGLERFANLGIRHFAVVLSLPEAEQEAFLNNAQQKRWTVEQLAGEIAEAGWPRPMVPPPRTDD